MYGNLGNGYNYHHQWPIVKWSWQGICKISEVR